MYEKSPNRISRLLTLLGQIYGRSKIRYCNNPLLTKNTVVCSGGQSQMCSKLNEVAQKQFGFYNPKKQSSDVQNQ